MQIRIPNLTLWVISTVASALISVGVERALAALVR